MTPHQRRAREHEALTRLIADCESQIQNAAVIRPAAIADIFEQHTSLLPDGSQLGQQWRGFAVTLRKTPTDAIDRAKLRGMVHRLQAKADDLALWLQRREARLRKRA